MECTEFEGIQNTCLHLRIHHDIRVRQNGRLWTLHNLCVEGGCGEQWKVLHDVQHREVPQSLYVADYLQRNDISLDSAVAVFVPHPQSQTEIPKIVKQKMGEFE